MTETLLEVRGVWPVEIRAEGRTLTGTFRYGSTATMSDRGTVRKESFGARAFSYAVDDPSREINLLVGHDLGKPLASKRAGSLELEDSAEALTFRAVLPDVDDQPTYMVDALKQYRAGLVGGISPGFRVPPRDVVPDAETLIPEPGNPGVKIRLIRAAVLFELSLVTRPAYDDTTVDLRSTDPEAEVRRQVHEMSSSVADLDRRPIGGRRWRVWL